MNDLDQENSKEKLWWPISRRGIAFINVRQSFSRSGCWERAGCRKRGLTVRETESAKNQRGDSGGKEASEGAGEDGQGMSPVMRANRLIYFLTCWMVVTGTPHDLPCWTKYLCDLCDCDNAEGSQGDKEGDEASSQDQQMQGCLKCGTMPADSTVVFIVIGVCSPSRS